MAMKCLPGFVGADRVRDALEEIIRRAHWARWSMPDLLETMNSVLARSISSSSALICAGTVESRMRSRGQPPLLSERRRQHFGAEAGAAHAEQDGVVEAVAI